MTSPWVTRALANDLPTEPNQRTSREHGEAPDTRDAREVRASLTSLGVCVAALTSRDCRFNHNWRPIVDDGPDYPFVMMSHA